MRAFKRSLTCLSHPAILLAIALLLLNDHVLKTAVPSWWTGKLSDVAGLAFFPFVVTAFLGLLSGKRDWSPRRIGVVAFAVTGGWFALMKTAPAANAATVALWSRLVGGPVRIVMDPADLLALVVLWPAWRLWTQASRLPSSRRHRRAVNWVGLLALCVGSLASLATSCEPILSVRQVFFTEGTLYAVEGYHSGNEYLGLYRRNLRTKGWEQVTEPSRPVRDKLTEPVSLPVEVCVAGGPCYRVTGDETVQRSLDGGESWEIAWQIPAGRREFMDRVQPLLCGKTIDVGPYDVAVTGTVEDHTVIVALGNEGVLVRHPDATWERQAVATAKPTPYIAAGIGDILLSLLNESIIVLLVVPFVPIISYVACIST